MARGSYNGVDYGDEDESSNPPPVPVKTLFLTFCILFIPMVVIPLVLLGLVGWGTITFESTGSEDLPVGIMPSTSNYYTQVSPAKFAMVASWASTVEGHISAPFLVLFSFLIAWTLNRNKARRAIHEEKARTHTEKRIRSLLQSRSFTKMLKYIRSLIPGRRLAATTDEAISVTVLGLTLNLIFTLLIVAGDNWLHATVQSQTYRQYGSIYRPTPDASASGAANVGNPNSARFSYSAGYNISSACEGFLNGSSSTPCSLVTSPFYNIYRPWSAYLVLQAGISDNSIDFGGINFTESFREQDSYTASGDQVITYLDPATNSNHSLLFYINAAFQNSSNEKTNWGYDFVAPSYSMQTTCEPLTAGCSMTNDSSLFSCSELFSGNLSADSTDGQVRIPGWDSMFYTVGSDGSAHKLDLAEAQNPFQYNVTVQVNAISDVLANISSSGKSSTFELPEPLVNTGNGNVGFAMSCKSTVYSVTYTVINETMANFKPTVADPKTAAIIRAPLQVGYGRYNLYQASIMGVIRAVTGTESLNSTIARTFSEVGVALSAGAFDYAPNIEQRQRADILVTEVPKTAVWFLAAVCFIYAFVALVVFVGALVVRKSEEVKSTQLRIGAEDAEPR